MTQSIDKSTTEILKHQPINLNWFVKFKISPAGYKFIDEKNARHLIFMMYPRKWEVDKDGYCKEQLWDFMNFFGEAMHNGVGNPVETEIIVLLDGAIL